MEPVGTPRDRHGLYLLLVPAAVLDAPYARFARIRYCVSWRLEPSHAPTGQERARSLL